MELNPRETPKARHQGDTHVTARCSARRGLLGIFTKYIKYLTYVVRRRTIE